MAGDSLEKTYDSMVSEPQKRWINAVSELLGVRDISDEDARETIVHVQ